MKDTSPSVSFVRAEALCTAPQEATCDSMHAQRHVWAFYRPQTHIMMLAVGLLGNVVLLV